MRQLTIPEEGTLGVLILNILSTLPRCGTRKSQRYSQFTNNDIGGVMNITVGRYFLVITTGVIGEL